VCVCVCVKTDADKETNLLKVLNWSFILMGTYESCQTLLKGLPSSLLSQSGDGNTTVFHVFQRAAVYTMKKIKLIL